MLVGALARFQYPLFRIVECISGQSPAQLAGAFVSISALSDRGMHLKLIPAQALPTGCFNIRSFGSWNASFPATYARLHQLEFQYPLFRIVECINLLGA